MHNRKCRLYIENMLSQKCKKIVSGVLKSLGFECNVYTLGEADVKGIVTCAQRQDIKILLSKYGLKLLDVEKTQLIDTIINLIDEKMCEEDHESKSNFSDYLEDKVAYEYSYLANLFSRIKGTTLNNYIIAHKIEKVKELLLYDHCSLTEISYKLDYSSVAHLSNQFKKVTGITPSMFKDLSSMRHQPEIARMVAMAS